MRSVCFLLTCFVRIDLYGGKKLADAAPQSGRLVGRSASAAPHGHLRPIHGGHKAARKNFGRQIRSQIPIGSSKYFDRRSRLAIVT